MSPKQLAVQLKVRLEDAFSPKKNLARLTAPRQAHFCSLDLLRIISSGWVIVTHSYSFALLWLNFEQNSASQLYRGFGEQFLANGSFAVDNFCLISGLLANWSLSQARASNQRPRTRHTTSELQQNDVTHSKFKTLARTVARRYLRLAPVMMIMILSSLLLLPRLCSEQKWTQSMLMFDGWCRTNWPINLIMMQNLLGLPEICFSHSWYVAVDFQLFVLLAFIFIIAGRERIEWKSSLVLVVIVQTINSALVHAYDLPARPLLPTRDGSIEKMNEFYKLVYIKPFHWLSSYFIGATLASFLRPRTKMRFNKGARIWLIGLNGLVAIILIFSNWFYFIRNQPMTRTYAAVYVLLAQPLWSLNMACLLMLSYNLKFNLVASKILTSISRLSYSAYLLHLVLIAAFYSSRNETFVFSHYLMLYISIGNVVLTYLGALIVFVLFESPIQTLATSFLSKQEAHSSCQLPMTS